MKLLIFEYITGGGFNHQDLPDALADEGRLMLEGLLNCFSDIKAIKLCVMLDWRIVESMDTTGINIFIIKSEHNTLDEFKRLTGQNDAVWPIAPEFDSILENLCAMVESLNKPLLTSPARAVALTGDKFKTYKQLIRNQIATVDTRLLEDFQFTAGEWMLKKVDGAGCGDSWLFSSQSDFRVLSENLQGNNCYIIQPQLKGEKTSLSCLFKLGCAWLLSVNLQIFKIVDNQYQLMEIVVNHQPDREKYKRLINEITHAFPDLWGYVGIDLIETSEEIKVLEINPRLTTSFVGIQSARGINVGRCVLNLLDGYPELSAQCDIPVKLTIKKDGLGN